MNAPHSRLAATLVLAGALLAAVSGCGPRSEASTPETPRTSPPAAKVVKPTRVDLPVTIEQPGQIEAFEQTPIYAKLGGYVAEVCVDMNAQVARGDCLARLHVPETEDELRQKQAAVAQAQAELEQVKRNLQTAEAAIRAATAHVAEARSSLKRALAHQERYDSEYQRIGQLVKQQVLDRQTLDEVRSQSKSAAANVEEAEAKIRTAEASCDESIARRDKVLADITVAQTRLQVARREEERTHTLLQYAVLQAPYAGVVTRRNVHTGHLLKPGDNAAREPMFVLARTDLVRIFVDVPEAEASRVRCGVPARVRIQALSDREIETTVARTSWALDPGNRTLRAEIELPNATGELRPGMYAYAAIVLEHPQAWSLPGATVHRSDGAAFCYLQQDGKSIRTQLRTGARHGDRVEVLKKREAADSSWRDFTGTELVLDGTPGALASKP